MSKKVIFDPKDFDKPQKKSGKKKLAWGIVICAALALIGIGWYAFLAPETEEAEEKEYLESSSETASPKGVQDLSGESTIDTVIVAEVEESVNPGEEASDDKAEKDKPSEALNQSSVPSDDSKPRQSPEATQGGESIDEAAMRVIRGDYGDGMVRKNQLGERYTKIQRRVNELKRQGSF